MNLKIYVHTLLFLTVFVHISCTISAEDSTHKILKSDCLMSDIIDLLVKERLEREQLLKENKDIKEKLNEVLQKVETWNTTVEELRKASNYSITTFQSSGCSEISEKRNYKTKQEGSGAIYTVWGRKACPVNNKLVYAGMAGGGNYNNPGSAVEPLCLPNDPLFGTKTKKTYSDILYGSEYVNDNFYGPHSADQDVPCAVCISRGSQLLMIPGRNKCYRGWNEEYHGYLGSNFVSNKRGSKYTCIHEHPEFLVGGGANKDGHVFHGVIAACGSLKCPPYINDKPVTCVICSR